MIVVTKIDRLSNMVKEEAHEGGFYVDYGALIILPWMHNDATTGTLDHANPIKAYAPGWWISAEKR